MAEPTPSTPSSSPTPQRSGRSWLWRGLAAGVTALMAACGSVPHLGGKLGSGGGGPSAGSSAASREYRQDAARHIYARNQHRIYKGQLPPMLYAVGVLEVELDRSGNVRRLRWLRAPSHAPEVVADIERTVRAASPFPAPSRMSGKLTYTDTWLWDQSGRFQLDTLTEGQRGE
ncbi:hypothetical protein [Comamonas sp. GB3 AK4-5]|uniref:hypothetical protein n=1 Tax=Comamonas sp. GB3 AK4-5 TaxID=3231487 RepID=UPI00351F13B8